MRSLLFALLAAFGLLGETSGFGQPSIVVYPFATSSEVRDPAGGAKLAAFITSKLNQLGGVIAKEPPPNTARPEFLTAARAAGVDYYVTGSMTPIGDDVALVVQLVSTSTGIVVWSGSSSVHTYAEAAAQADSIRSAALAHFTGSLPSYTVRSPAPSASAKISPKASRATPSAAPAATPTAAPSATPAAANANP